MDFPIPSNCCQAFIREDSNKTATIWLFPLTKFRVQSERLLQRKSPDPPSANQYDLSFTLASRQSSTVVKSRSLGLRGVTISEEVARIVLDSPLSQTYACLWIHAPKLKFKKLIWSLLLNSRLLL